MGIPAGILNRYGRLEVLTGTKLQSGQVDPDDWTLVKETWANIRGQTGMSSIRNATGDDVNAQVAQVSIRIRHFPEASNRMRFYHIKSGRYYYVIDVREDEDGQVWTDLIAQRTNPHG